MNRPSGLGGSSGRAGSPRASNWVSGRRPLRFEGGPEESWGRLKRALASQPRTRVVTEQGDYLHAESTSLIFRFIDDVEFLLERGAKVIHVRSASRAGRSDLGVNRRRVEALRRAFQGGSV